MLGELLNIIADKVCCMHCCCCCCCGLQQEDLEASAAAEEQPGGGGSATSNWVQCASCSQWRVVPLAHWPSVQSASNQDWVCKVREIALKTCLTVSMDRLSSSHCVVISRGPQFEYLQAATWELDQFEPWTLACERY